MWSKSYLTELIDQSIDENIKSYIQWHVTLHIHTHTHTYRSLNKVDAGLQVKPKVDKVPLNAFALVLLLLQHKHGMVKKLLKLFIGVVYTQLLKGVQLEKIQENIRKKEKG